VLLLSRVTTIRLALRLPERCRFCNAVGSVSLEQTIKGKSVVLTWCCQRCDQEWPVTPEEEEHDRRLGTDERRRTSRKDRRQRP
jgi:hypothetical protein